MKKSNLFYQQNILVLINMPNYYWKGVNQEGNKISGLYFANDKNRLLKHLTGKHITLLQYHKKSPTKINNIDFFRNLLSLLQAGISLTEALSLIRNKNSGNPFIEHLLNQLAQGHPLSKILQDFPRIFNHLIINLIHIGEKTGTLENQLHQIIIYQTHYKKLQQKIKNALIYPIIVICLTFLLLITISCFVIPKFNSFFASMNGQIPIFTQLVILVAEKSKYLFISLTSIVLILLGIWKIKTRKNFKAQEYLWRGLMHLPIIGKAIKLHLFSLALRTLATTLKAGILLTDALIMAADITPQPIYHKALLEMSRQLHNGLCFAEILAHSQIFNTHIKQLLALGEQSGKLDETCEYLANDYFMQLHEYTKRLSMLIEPIITIVLSVIIGAITIALYLPLFSLGGLF